MRMVTLSQISKKDICLEITNSLVQSFINISRPHTKYMHVNNVHVEQSGFFIWLWLETRGNGFESRQGRMFVRLFYTVLQTV